MGGCAESKLKGREVRVAVVNGRGCLEKLRQRCRLLGMLEGVRCEN